MNDVVRADGDVQKVAAEHGGASRREVQREHVERVLVPTEVVPTRTDVHQGRLRINTATHPRVRTATHPRVRTTIRRPAPTQRRAQLRLRALRHPRPVLLEMDAARGPDRRVRRPTAEDKESGDVGAPSQRVAYPRAVSHHLRSLRVHLQPAPGHGPSPPRVRGRWFGWWVTGRRVISRRNRHRRSERSVVRYDGVSPPLCARRVLLRARHRLRRVDGPRHDELIRGGPVRAEGGGERAHVAVEPRGRALGEIPFFPRSSGPSIGSIARASIHTSLSSTLGLDFTVYASVPRVPRACRGIDGDRTERIERFSDAVRR